MSSYSNSSPNIIDRDDSPLKNFTMLPNIIWELNLSSYAFKLYATLRRLVGNREDRTYKSRAELAKISGMSSSQISKAKDELIQAGLIEVEKRDRVKHETDITYLLPIWDRNTEYFSNRTGRNTTTQVSNTTTPEEKTGRNTTTSSSNTTAIINLNILEEFNIKSLGEPANAVPNKVKTSTVEQKSEPLSKHPVIQMFRETLGRYPAKEKMLPIIQAVGEEYDLNELTTVAKEWLLRGYNQTNYSGIIAAYHRGGLEAQGKQIGFTSNQQKVHRAAPVPPPSTKVGFNQEYYDSLADKPAIQKLYLRQTGKVDDSYGNPRTKR